MPGRAGKGQKALKKNNTKIDSRILPIFSADKTRLVQLFRKFSDAVTLRSGKDPVIYRVRPRYKHGTGSAGRTPSGSYGVCMTKNYLGTEVGFVIRRKIVERRGDGIYVPSQPEKGSKSTFSIARRE